MYRLCVRASDTANTASIDARQDDTIEYVTITGVLSRGAAVNSGDETVLVEVSFVAQPLGFTNDTTAPIALLNLNRFGPTETGDQFAVTVPVMEAWNAGERLYIHVNTPGSDVVVQADALIVTKKGTQRAAVRRR